MKITVFDYREMIPFEIKVHWGILWNPATEWKTHLLGYWYLKYLFFFKYVNLCALPQEEFPRESVPFLFLGLEVSSGRKWALLLVIQNVIASYDITWHLWATLATPLVRLIRREVDNGWISLLFSPRFSRTFRLTLVWNCEWMFVLRVSERGRIRTDWYICLNSDCALPTTPFVFSIFSRLNTSYQSQQTYYGTSTTEI